MSVLRILLPALGAVAVIGAWPLAAAASPEITARAKKFLAAHEAKVRPLEIKGAEAWWRANTSGKAEDFKAKEEAQNQLDAALADPAAFKEAKALKDALKEIDDPVLARAVAVIYLAYLEKQVDTELLKKMTAKANAVEKAFNEFRPKVDGKEVTDNQVRKILRTSTLSEKRKEAWEASKKVGEAVEADLKELVKLRNEAARKL
ncbi:MAG TPA: M2 family metallopeptidase, partial [Gemmataceae bacterium]|nr:M2 family metallopeptidase [Gemmataceae bacterium]